MIIETKLLGECFETYHEIIEDKNACFKTYISFKLKHSTVSAEILFKTRNVDVILTLREDKSSFVSVFMEVETNNPDPT